MTIAQNQIPLHCLPDGQHYIRTSQVIRAERYVENLVSGVRKFGVQRIGLILGKAGVGKTSFASHLLSNSKILEHTQMTEDIYFKVSSGWTPKAFCDRIMIFFGEAPGSLSHFNLMEPIRDKLIDNSIRLIILDEGGRINHHLFDKIRDLADDTGSIFLILGVPDVDQLITREPQFASRVLDRFELLPLSLGEMLEIYLPQLKIPRWNFDPSKSSDRTLGERIWNVASPDLRKVQNLLILASKYAERIQSNVITPQIVELIIQNHRHG